MPSPQPFRKKLASPHNADAVVGKRVVKVRHFDLRHVAGHAFRRSNFTRWLRMLGGNRLPRRRMTRQTLRVVLFRLPHRGRVRVMARNAGQPLIAVSPALTLL